MRREFQVAKTLAIVTIVFIAFIIPFNIIYFITDFTHLTYLEVTRFHASIWIIYLNSTLNPFLYGLLNRDFLINGIIITPKLNNKQNYLILSLSITDLFVGLLLMPVLAYRDVVQTSDWKYGSVMCDIYHFLNINCTVTSYLHLLFIAIDRYLSFTRHQYLRNKSKSHIMAMIAISWILPPLISIWPLLGFRDNHLFMDRINRNICYSVGNNRLIKSAILSSAFIGFIIIAILQRNEFQILNETQTVDKCDKTMRQDFRVAMTLAIITIVITDLCVGVFLMPLMAYYEVVDMGYWIITDLCVGVFLMPLMAYYEVVDMGYWMYGPASIKLGNTRKYSDINEFQRQQSVDKNDKIMRREFRVAKTLAIVTMVFVLCLAPYNVMNYRHIISSQTPDYKELAYLRTTIWLACFNSTLNPILYAFLNKDFRVAFKRILYYN
ncbi:unnamed protein product [Oppiella nova]|uniref:G-protein coupled receptors family 1 profile domain-containing protein n=1 Tax=Oppiella nova TaxID=334625 RepID=A0A7R9QCX1_9ACAR|nr:unnamed protein product [Oppiella nova]CAG2163394.1 unnamed protein product [Oppiella nova]